VEALRCGPSSGCRWPRNMRINAEWWSGSFDTRRIAFQSYIHLWWGCTWFWVTSNKLVTSFFIMHSMVLAFLKRSILSGSIKHIIFRDVFSFSSCPPFESRVWLFLGAICATVLCRNVLTAVPSTDSDFWFAVYGCFLANVSKCCWFRCAPFVLVLLKMSPCPWSYRRLSIHSCHIVSLLEQLDCRLSSNNLDSLLSAGVEACVHVQ